MKLRMKLDNRSMLLSAIILIVLLYLLRISTDIVSVCIIGFCIMVGCACALFYMPMSITLNEKELCVNRSLWFKRIALKDIASIELKEPENQKARICGSAGWFGYWGWYKDSELGWYFVYSGSKYPEYLFISLKDGRKYMIGCENPDEVLSHIKTYIV